MKTCWKCKIEKPLGEFYKDSRQPDQKQKACKTCQQTRNIEYGAKHKQYFKEKGIERYQKCLEDNPNFNKERYHNQKKDFVKRRFEYSKTLRGALKGLLNSAQTRARIKNMEYDIDYDFILDLYNTQDGKCKLTNIPFTNIRSTNENKRNYNPHNISLDRIDSKKGYIKDNVRLVLVSVNVAINSFGDEQFENIATEFLKLKGFTIIK